RAKGGPLLARVGGGTIAGRRFGGHMLAMLPRYRWPQTAHVNSLTTLAARYSRAHPQIDGRRAASRTRRFLRLGPGYLLGLDGRTNVGFDGRRFLREAGAVGYDTFVTRLLRRMNRPGVRRSFRPPRGPRRAVSTGRALLLGNGAQGAAEIGEAISNGTGFFEALEKTDYVLDFADAVIDITGLGNDSATAAELQEVSAQLRQVEEGVAALRSEVGGLKKEFANSAYSSKAENELENYEGIATAEDTIQTALQLAAQSGCTAKPPAEPEQCAKAGELLEAFGRRYGAEGPATVPKMKSYAAGIAGSAAPEGSGLGEGLLQAGSRLTTDAQDQVFYTAEDSQLLTSISAYWVSNYTQGLVLAPLYWQLQNEGPAVLKNEAEQLAPFAKALQAAVPRQVAPGVVIDMVHGTMWPTESSAIGTGEPWSWFVNNGPWRYVRNFGEGTGWKSVTSGAVVPAIGTPPQANIPYSDWLVAGLGHIEPLLRLVEPEGGQTPGEAVLEQAGIDEDVIIPPYGSSRELKEPQFEELEPPVPPGRGLEMEYQLAGNLYEVEEGLHINSGCFKGKSSCFWPVWVGDNATIGNFNWPSPTYTYAEGTFEVSDPLDISWYGSPLWGYDNKSTIYGNDPVDNIPNLFFREVTGNECYYYPDSGASAAGSPGCPG
ncbi:MAG: hypothetical protein M3Y75_05420, partial [Actinomycetota bacterium]|nr:hypothetical protein [Actinomycetota bacterium]